MSALSSGRGALQEASGARGKNDTLTGPGWVAFSSDGSEEAQLSAQARPLVQEGEKMGWSFSQAASCPSKGGPLWTVRLAVTSQTGPSLS